MVYLMFKWYISKHFSLKVLKIAVFIDEFLFTEFRLSIMSMSAGILLHISLRIPGHWSVQPDRNHLDLDNSWISFNFLQFTFSGFSFRFL